MKAATIILIALALALGAAMLVQHNKAVEQKNADVAEKVELTNRLEVTRAKFEEQERIAMYLQTNLTVREQELLSTSNSLLKTAADLAKTQKEAQAAADAAKAEMAKREARINELETQKDALDKQAVDLKSAIGNLEKSITDTEKKLAASEGDREFLLKELKRLQTEKAELERQFNDLAVLRTLVLQERLTQRVLVEHRLLPLAGVDPVVRNGRVELFGLVQYDLILFDMADLHGMRPPAPAVPRQFCESRLSYSTTTVLFRHSVFSLPRG